MVTMKFKDFIPSSCFNLNGVGFLEAAKNAVPKQTSCSSWWMTWVLVIWPSKGAKDMRTPNIDAMMRAGLKFNNFYANSCVCSPTRASLMTGLYPDKAGVPGVIRLIDNNSWGYLNPDLEIFLPSRLDRAGHSNGFDWKMAFGASNTPAPAK